MVKEKEDLENEIIETNNINCCYRSDNLFNNKLDCYFL